MRLIRNHKTPLTAIEDIERMWSDVSNVDLQFISATVVRKRGSQRDAPLLLRHQPGTFHKKFETQRFVTPILPKSNLDSAMKLSV